eukprot:scaffold10812_cov28-Tisochrysis_lutea.AAC.4
MVDVPKWCAVVLYSGLSGSAKSRAPRCTLTAPPSQCSSRTVGRKDTEKAVVPPTEATPSQNLPAQSGDGHVGREAARA